MLFLSYYSFYLQGHEDKKSQQTMFRTSIFLFLFLFIDCLSAQDYLTNIYYKSKILDPKGGFFKVQESADIKVSFYKSLLYSSTTIEPGITHLVDAEKSIRYRNNDTKMTYKIERIQPDSTTYKYTYTHIKDSLAIKGFMCTKHRFSLFDEKENAYYQVNIWTSDSIQIAPVFSKFVMSELFFLKVPFQVTGCVIKAVAEVKRDNVILARGQLEIDKWDSSPNSFFDFRKSEDKGYRKEK